MNRLFVSLSLLAVLLSSCTPVDLDAPAPVYATGVDPDAWAVIPAGPFLQGQEAHPASIDYDYAMMVTDVTVARYVRFLNDSLTDGTLKIDGNQVVGFYPGDVFRVQLMPQGLVVLAAV